MENRSLEASLLILNRTRRSLSASSLSSGHGQGLLDRALAKQISTRQAELDCNLQRFRSVIARTSTPDPEAAQQCEESCLENQVFSENSVELISPTQIPEDFSIPLQNFLDSLSTTAPPPPGQLSLLGVPQPEGAQAGAGGTPVITRGPRVPWSPPRAAPCPAQEIGPGSLLDILTESASLLCPLFEPPVTKESSNDIMELEQIKKDCRGKERLFNQLCRRFAPEDFDGDSVARYRDTWTDQLNDAIGDLVGSVEDMVDEHRDTLGTPEVETWNLMVSGAELKFKQLVCKYQSSTTREAVQTPQDDHTPAPNNQALRAAKVNIEIDDDIVSKESIALSKEVKKYLDCEQIADEDIETALGKVEEWNKKFERLKDKTYAIKRNSECFNLNDPRVSNSQNAVANLEQELNVAIEQLKDEDNKRCLYSLAKSKTAAVKLPMFTGERAEDFSKFRKEVEKGMKTNRVRKHDQVAKLRECLRQGPKALIPYDMEDIEKAWKILTNMYGDTTRVMAARKEKLRKLGPLPKNGKAAHALKAQVEWLISLETTLTDIMGLADSSLDMEYEAYNGSMVRTVRQLFHVDMVEKLTFPGTAKYKIQKMKDFAVELREAKQELLKDHEGYDGGGDGGDDSRGGADGGHGDGAYGRHSDGGDGRHGDGGNGRYGTRKDRKKSRYHPEAAVAFKGAIRHEQCRICNQLNVEGDTAGLYDGHTHDVAGGCPRFAGMGQKKRAEIVKKVKLCSSCLDADFIMRPGVVHDSCPVKNNKPKPFYSCRKKDCMLHYLICQHHKNENIRKVESSKKYWSGMGVTFSYHSSHSVKPELERNVFDMASEENDAAEVSEEYNAADVFENHETSTNDVCNHEPVQQLKDLANGSTVLDVPEGEPLFLFSSAVGRTRSIKIFYDGGCSHVVIKDDIPVKELPGVVTRKGPLTINGVGGTRIKVGDEWACLLDLCDGTKQTIQGVTVKQITSKFPMIKIKEATLEIKASRPRDKRLQSLRVPLEVGGETDILLGTLYNAIFPVIVHTLPCGLFIAKLKIASFGSKWTGVVGGPHRSFQALAEQTGSPSYLMAHFIEGLKNFRSYGAPKIKGPMMSWEDEQFARTMSKAEVEDITGGSIDDDENKESSEEDLGYTEEDFGYAEGDVKIQGTIRTDKAVQCGSCGKDVVEDMSTIIDEVKDVFDYVSEGTKAFSAIPSEADDKLAGLKMLIKLQESGISLDYRCPSCRDCSSCRNAPDTERISLREEAEDQAMKESVHIDFKNKKITCKLPLRGKVEEFLSDNREVALKVLNSQCKKVQDDEEAKATIIKSFYKLFDGKYAVKFSDLSEADQKMILSAKVQHYLPWRCVYKQSISTPCRTVMDASSRTPLLRNGQGGRCLNDLTMKGKVNTLDLLTMLLRFVIGRVGFAGDLKQFYTSMALDPSQWNLQRVLWREGMDMSAEVEEIVILSLIFGVRAVSALSEWALKLLADYVRSRSPRLAELLERSRFVDDLGDSDESLEAVKKLIAKADELFESVGLQCKGWSISGSNPHPDVTKDEISIDVAGMEWCPAIDTVSVKIPPLHFGKKSRGKLRVGTEVFDGSFEDLEKFVPQKLTRRMAVSKFAALFDMLGHLTPETAKMKLNVSDATKETDAWDDAVPPELRQKIVKDLWRLFKLQGLKFRRAVIPDDAVNLKAHLTACVDAANKLKIVGVWVRFLRKCGKYSSQLLIGRSLLSRGGTIPKEELEAMTIGSNLLAVCRKALEGWLEDYSLFSDSVISICWVTSEKKRLSLYHRNRVVQIKLHTDIEKIFHVRTDFNPADIGTRPEHVKEDDVGPNSIWEKGFDWMHNDFEEAVANDIIKPAKMLRMKEEEEEEYEKGLIFERSPEILIRGHFAFSAARVEKMLTRAEFSKYLFSPSKFSFKKVIRITAQMLKFLRLKKLEHSTPMKTVFKMFVATLDDEEKPRMDEIKLAGYFSTINMHNVTEAEAEDKNATTDGNVDVVDWFALSAETKPRLRCKRTFREDLEISKKVLNLPTDGAALDDIDAIDVCSEITDDDVNRALAYWYKKGSEEVKRFNKKEHIAKIAVEKDGILYSRSRIMDGHRFIVAAGLHKNSIGKEVQLNLFTPVLDRHSPISYSVALFVHSELANHAGFETCFRFSLSYCHIIQAASLFREIGEECSKCRIVRKKFLDVLMGPVSDHQLTICPPFYAAYCDLDGPYRVYVPGHERETRHRRVVEAKTWILSFACPVSKLINLQVVESKSADGVLDGLTRLGCEQGFPKFLLLDQEKSFMKAVKDAQVDLRDLSLRCYKEHGIRCETAPVSGHNYTGLIERKIRTVQEAFDKIGMKSKKLHATGLQTIAKLVENSMNNLPMGFSYGKDADNTPLLKLITPNLMKIGRLNSRVMDGPVRFPTGPKDLMVKVEEVFDAFFRIWNISCVPKLIPQPKWFKDSPELKPEDVVYFQKSESDLTSKWTVGQIDSIIRSKDGVIRRAWVRYHNSGEKDARLSDRAVRSLVRIFNVEDNYFIRDMAEVERMIQMLDEKVYESDGEPVTEKKVQPTKLVKAADGKWVRAEDMPDVMTARKSCDCCCPGHCRFNVHNMAGSVMGVNFANKVATDLEQLEFPKIFESYLFDEEEYDVPIKSNLVVERDELYDAITCLETDFNLD